jgi:hypothetical protein
MVVNDNSRVVNKFATSFADDARVIIYDLHILIVHSTVVCVPCKPFLPFLLLVGKAKSLSYRSAPFMCSTWIGSWHKTLARIKMLAWDKHSSLSDEQKKFFFNFDKTFVFVTQVFQVSLIFVINVGAYQSECSKSRLLGSYSHLIIFSIAYEQAIEAREFTRGKSFQPSLMFGGKAGSYLIEAPYMCSTLGLAPGLTHKY